VAALGAGEVVPFDPMAVFDEDSKSVADRGSDLLVFIEPGRSLGRSNFYWTLRSLDSGEAGFKRERGLVISNCRGCEYYAELMDRWKLEEHELPVAMLFPNHREHSALGKFRLDLAGVAKILPELVHFVETFDAGQWRPWVRGLPIPTKEEQQGPVFEVVGRSFLEEVVEKDIDVLLLMYGPYCGFSRLVQPVFAELGQRLGRDNKYLRVAKFDSTQNEMPTGRWAVEAETQHVPRIYLFLQGKKHTPDMFPPEVRDKTLPVLLEWLRPRVPKLAAWLDGAVEPSADGGEGDDAEF